MAAELKIAIDNELTEISRLCAECEEFLEQQGASTGCIYAVNLALEEMATNIVKYGYDDLQPHQIHAVLTADDEFVTVRLEDDGHAFNPLTLPPPPLPQSLEDRQIGGLGIHLVRQTVDAMEYQRCGNRNVLTIRVRRAR